ncbi:Wzy polymerase domain-containing protein [Rhodoferax antarcticus]|uniref:Wzy polymerase domain-containing protein n=1 Tax=Rhodoferax antarcticus TaxID=81479 RepID=UPI00222514BC|nr:Wzy polymerase domain-containing protein [Rhodoferax antarcticus]MCW2313304.1 O-antigen ligase [Rhodoferax antarcticus]
MPALAVFLFVTLPWLNPFTPGPVAQVGPLLFAWVCAAGVLLAFAFDRQRGENPQIVSALTAAWAVAACLSALVGLAQYFGAASAFGVWVNHTGVGEAFGNLRQRNQFATLQNIGLFALVWLAAPALAVGARHSAAGERAFPWQSLRSPALLLGAALLGAGNAASSSRTGLLQLFLVWLLVWGWQRTAGRNAAQPRWRLTVRLAVVLTTLLAFTLATFALPWLAGLDPLGSGAWARLRAGDSACASRLTLWGNVLHLIELKPWLGWGWGELDYAHFVTLYPGERFCAILDNAHNLPLHLAVELGLPAALALCGGALWLVWRGQPWREQHPTRQLAWGVLAVIGLHSLLEYPLWYGPFQMAAVLSVWLLWWVPRHSASAGSYKSFRPLALYSYALIALIIVAYCSFAAWNYYLVSQLYLPANQRANAYRENTLQKVRSAWLYQDTVRFAELTTTALTADNAAYQNALAKNMLHFSPEAKVVEVLLNSAVLLGRTDVVTFYAARYRAAFPKDDDGWMRPSSAPEAAAEAPP